jgi:hypothetical protein
MKIMQRRSSDDALILGDEILIGQTLLEKMDFVCGLHSSTRRARSSRGTDQQVEITILSDRRIKSRKSYYRLAALSSRRVISGQ